MDMGMDMGKHKHKHKHKLKGLLLSTISHESIKFIIIDPSIFISIDFTEYVINDLKTRGKQVG
jgi:hypothetical protein